VTLLVSVANFMASFKPHAKPYERMMNMNHSMPFLRLSLLTLLLTAGSARAENITAVRYGGDERARWEYFDHIPSKVDVPAYSRGGENDYFRFRTRLWTELDILPSVTAKARVVNEVRSWVYPDMSQKPQRSSSEWPDEFVFDNLYLEARDLLDKTVDIRAGRQELQYGNGRVMLDGTPGDGSRTLYFNAAKATVKSIPDSQLDLFGIYNPPEDQLAINGAQRDLSAFARAPEGVTESGAGMYLKNSTLKTLPLEAYLIFKRESAYDQPVKPDASGKFATPTYAWQTLDTSAKVLRNPDNDIETAGFRLMPVFNDTLTGNLEVAGQYGQHGDTDMHGYMVDAYLAQKFASAPATPVLKGGVYLLSGDDPNTATDEGWNPLWARCPQSSELLVFAYDAEQSAFRWSNLINPNLSLSITPTKRTKTTATIHYLAAMEADGNGGGRERGWMGQLRQDFTLAENALRPKDKLTTYFLLECLEPGNYYKNTDTAVFARWEILYAF
jgi:hypothetical protein